MRHQEIVNKLNLEPHPEGGFYKRIYQSDVKQPFAGFDGERYLLTAIQYLLDGNHYSAWHRIKSDEIWVISEANTELWIYELVDNEIIKTCLSQSKLQHTVKAGRWFAAELAEQTSDKFCLCHCMVSPGFDFADFELAKEQHFAEFSQDMQRSLEKLLG